MHTDDLDQRPEHVEPLPFTAPWHYELHFPCDPRAPRVARVILRAVLAAHGLAGLADRAELLASELATNSVRYTKGAASVRLQWLHPVLRVSVSDTGPDLPQLPGARHADADADAEADSYAEAEAAEGDARAPVPQAEGGRGLFILAAVADRWGSGGTGADDAACCRAVSDGKSLWFELVAAGQRP